MTTANTRIRSRWPFTLNEMRQTYLRVRAAMMESRRRREKYSRTVRELASLSDRDLWDIGFHRSDIPRIAREESRRIGS